MRLPVLLLVLAAFVSMAGATEDEGAPRTLFWVPFYCFSFWFLLVRKETFSFVHPFSFFFRIDTLGKGVEWSALEEADSAWIWSFASAKHR
jgi:hypothetical protein